MLVQRLFFVAIVVIAVLLGMFGVKNAPTALLVGLLVALVMLKRYCITHIPLDKSALEHS